MVIPVDGIRSIHNAFRKDMANIDTAALDLARGKGSAMDTFKRLEFYMEVLDWHAKGEEAGIFPALEKVAPDVAWAYERDHRGLDEASGKLIRSSSAGDYLETARASAALRFHLKIHLAKEDAHLYRIFAERVPMPEQMEAMGVMSSHVPQDRFLDVVAWWMPLVGLEDRENIVRIWQMVLPIPVFEKVREVVHTVTGDEWVELTRRIPGL
ncbi:hemerythrin domain-containing protein [Methanogenium organophilum]|uniref:Hemerythrin domain-containing protein n=1 Tax=Methanogenium organophilum TaxID=2199 RepID=A0A9X9S2C7_METOG|nr:hemerythrin domain-containing protein [Methanogenium organophilum]WAI00543.1 hemerythrin domain-containing protein [Methanogenium organophilum]